VNVSNPRLQSVMYQPGKDSLDARRPAGRAIDINGTQPVLADTAPTLRYRQFGQRDAACRRPRSG
jgi:hypothetical protein